MTLRPLAHLARSIALVACVGAFALAVPASGCKKQPAPDASDSNPDDSADEAGRPAPTAAAKEGHAGSNPEPPTDPPTDPATPPVAKHEPERKGDRRLARSQDRMLMNAGDVQLPGDRRTSKRGLQREAGSSDTKAPPAGDTAPPPADDPSATPTGDTAPTTGDDPSATPPPAGALAMPQLALPTHDAPPPHAPPAPEAAPPTREDPRPAASATRLSPIDPELLLPLAMVLEVTGQKNLTARGALPGIATQPGYLSTYFATAAPQKFGVAMQLWQDATAREASDRLMRMRNQYAGAELITALNPSKAFYANYAGVHSITFAVPTKRSVASVACGDTTCTQEQLLKLAQAFRNRL